MAATRIPWLAVDGEIADLSDFNTAGRDLEGYAKAVTNTTGVVGSVTDVSGLTVSPTIQAGRTTCVKAFIPRIASDTANDAVEVYIKQDGTIIQSCFMDLSARTSSGSGGNAVYIETEPLFLAAASYTFKVSMVRATGGSGILATVLDSDSVAWIRVCDEGPAF